jgi:hypothetical protein
MANVPRPTQIESSVASGALFCVKRAWLVTPLSTRRCPNGQAAHARLLAQASGAWASIRRDHEAASCDHSSVSTTGLRRAAAGSHRCVGSSSNANRRKRQRWSLLAQPWLGSFGRCGAGLHCTAGDCTLTVSTPEYCRLHCTARRLKAQNNIRVAHSTAYDMKNRTTHAVQPTGNVRSRPTAACTGSARLSANSRQLAARTLAHRWHRTAPPLCSASRAQVRLVNEYYVATFVDHVKQRRAQHPLRAPAPIVPNDATGKRLRLGCRLR